MQAQLNKSQNLILASKWRKFFHMPFRYIFAFVFRKWIYPYTQKGKRVTKQTFFGIDMQLILPAAIDIYLFGCKSHDSEIRLSRFMLNHLNENDTFIDVGAHFGFFSLLASKIVKEKGNVISFEAARSTFDILKQNTHKYKNIISKHKACFSENKLLTFYEFPVNYSEYNALNKVQYENKDWLEKHKPKAIEIEGVKLDNECKGLPISMIKIDVEGAELDVLQGMENLIKNKQVKFIILEYLNDNRKESVHQKAADFLQKHHYSPYAIQQDGSLKLIESFEILKYVKLSKIDSDNIVFMA